MRFIGKRYKFYIPDGENPKASKARTSFAPNLVHSMDASHMWATIDRLQADGLDSFAMVHDSYGVHACDVDILHTAIRESFVDLYKDYCPMKALTEAYPDVDFPDLPTKGTYQIESVLDAPYFFA